MSRIALIDTYVDPTYINKPIQYIDLCEDSNGEPCRHGLTHGTMCAAVLDHCACDYELINIRILASGSADSPKPFGKIEQLAEALRLCGKLNVDIVSLSAVSSLLSDSRYLYDITHDLAENTVIVSALDNRRYVTVPASYPFVLGVQNDWAGLLQAGEIAYRAGDPLGAEIYANCNFDLLKRQRHGPSNSFAVPVVSAYINDLINKGRKPYEIFEIIHNLSTYRLPPERERMVYPGMPVTREIPIVFIEGKSALEFGRLLMDGMYDKYSIQSTGLLMMGGAYDIRLKHITNTSSLQNDVHFMRRHYKTDLIFIITPDDNGISEAFAALEGDVMLRCRGTKAVIEYENERLTVNTQNVLDGLNNILSSDLACETENTVG